MWPWHFHSLQDPNNSFVTLSYGYYVILHKSRANTVYYIAIVKCQVLCIQCKQYYNLCCNTQGLFILRSAKRCCILVQLVLSCSSWIRSLSPEIPGQLWKRTQHQICGLQHWIYRQAKIQNTTTTSHCWSTKKCVISGNISLFSYPLQRWH